MKKIILITGISSLILFSSLLYYSYNLDSSNKLEFRNGPDEWLYNQRAWPYRSINNNAYLTSKKQALNLLKSKNKDFNGSWVSVGPINIGGRITDIEMPANDTNIIFIGTASGGIFKTINHGISWFPIFDNELSLSIGDLKIDPNNPNIIYAGTGEANASSNNGAFPGNGIYKSMNGGISWSNIGLPNSQNIGRIIINPLNSNNLFVAVMGQLYGTNNERGVYRSVNGGSSWQKVLYVNDSTGCVDLTINPINPDIVYASMWQRIKYPFASMRCGAGSGIYKSTDGGTNWTQLTNGLPTSDSNTGRIGIDISPTNPNILYASYSTNTQNNFDGIYKTTDAGVNWIRVDNISTDINNGYGWYFGNIRIDPNNANIVYALGLNLWQTVNGGTQWTEITNWYPHVDHHALLINPLNSQSIVNGNDGGIYYSNDGGSNWTFDAKLPITQFYTSEIDFQNPSNLYGGSQDNSTMRTLTGNIDDWEIIHGGDGFYVLVDPTNSNNIYCEYQWGEFSSSTNGGLSFNWAMNGINSSDRTNWNTPVVFDPSNSQTLYYGSNYLYKSIDASNSWYPISNDLTDNNGNYSSITTIAVAPTNGDVIYVGTDDANVWVSNNGGNTWSDITLGLPMRYVSRVAVDPNDASIAYVTFSGYKLNDYLPHIFRTTNYGVSWQDISGNLPEGPINDIIPDPLYSSFLYIATDFGVFSTSNLGTSWQFLGDSIPLVPIFDLTLHNPSRILVAATYGRSIYKYDLNNYTSVNDLQEGSLKIVVLPNPTTGIVIIKGKDINRIEVLDINGRQIYKGKETQIDLRQEPNGIYLIRIITDKKIITKKIIKH